jgi:hypothetical protein
MMRLLKRLLSVVRDRAKVMVDLDKTGRELDKSLRRSSKSKVLRKDPGQPSAGRRYAGRWCSELSVDAAVEYHL